VNFPGGPPASPLDRRRRAGRVDSRPVKPLAAALVFLVAGAAHTGAPGDARVAAVTVSPLHLLDPTLMLEVQSELYLGETFSAAVIAGVGRVTVEVRGAEDTTYNTVEIGGQLRGYVFGSTREGLFLGPELLYFNADGITAGASGVANGGQIGALCGYKWVWRSGFVLDVGAGVRYLFSAADTRQGDASFSAVRPLFNVGLGYAF